MTPDQLEAKIQAIINDIKLGEGIAGELFAPIAPYVVIAQAVESMIPGLVATVDKWVQGTPPTADEEKAMLAQLAVLADPNAP